MRPLTCVDARPGACAEAAAYWGHVGGQELPFAAVRSLPLSSASDWGVPRLTLVRRGRFAEGRFEPDMMATMGIDFRLKDIDVRESLLLFFPSPPS